MKSVLTTLIIVLLFALPTLDAHCQAANANTIKPINKIVTPATEGPTVCPNPKKLRGMCMLLSSQEKDAIPQGRFNYKYQRKFLEAACVDVNKDSEEVIAQKISKVWKENEDTLICNNTKFDVNNGNIIKFAANIKFDNFITDMALWKVNLNKVDKTDGRTVLDYIKDQIERNKGLATEPVLQGYYNQLKKAGAKHRVEL